jgi:MoaA/NifB/PqqE/SkfB family radical SAM enzyme
MKLSGLHLLLTYRCNFECEHCFVWGSPWQSGTMTLSQIGEILDQAERLGSIEWIFFEGGEPFLYYPVLLKGVQMAARRGFRVGIVSNGYWATDVADALEWLRPLSGFIQELSISSDRFHSGEEIGPEARNARAAAETLGIHVGVIQIAQPEATQAELGAGQLPPGESGIMYRGRAAERLVSRASRRPWEELSECPYEDLREPGRAHVDPLGNLHLCQGISLGNLFREPLDQICRAYDADSHPIVGPLLEGGPAELIRRHGLRHDESYADECHLCYTARRSLRGRFPNTLTPDQMYGGGEAQGR